MATLNIKSFPDKLARKLRERAAKEHRSVTQQVIHLLSIALLEEGELSILELRGLGREHWKEREPSEHIARERGAWD